MAVGDKWDDPKYTGFSKYFNSYTIRGRSNWSKLWVSFYALSYLSYKLLKHKSSNVQEIAQPQALSKSAEDGSDSYPSEVEKSSAAENSTEFEHSPAADDFPAADDSPAADNSPDVEISGSPGGGGEDFNPANILPPAPDVPPNDDPTLKPEMKTIDTPPTPPQQPCYPQQPAFYPCYPPPYFFCPPPPQGSNQPPAGNYYPPCYGFYPYGGQPNQNQPNGPNFSTPPSQPQPQESVNTNYQGSYNQIPPECMDQCPSSGQAEANNPCNVPAAENCTNIQSPNSCPQDQHT